MSSSPELAEPILDQGGVSLRSASPPTARSKKIASTSPSKKRKRTVDSGSSKAPNVKVGKTKKRKNNEDNTGDAGNGQKAKVGKSKKHKEAADDTFDVEKGLNLAFAHMDSPLLADYLAASTRKFESDLSSIELEDRYIGSTTIRDTTTFDKPRTLDNLPAFLEKFCSNPTKLWSASKKNGAPHTIIIAGAGLRAAELARIIRKFQTKEATVAKLFAKHIKLQDAVNFLKSNRTGIAVGTPVRLNDLMEDGALAVDRLERIVIDSSHIDMKKRGILDMKETQVPLMQWLNRTEFKARYGAETSGIDLLFF